jgi:hypothetical protein
MLFHVWHLVRVVPLHIGMLILYWVPRPFSMRLLSQKLLLPPLLLQRTSDECWSLQHQFCAFQDVCLPATLGLVRFEGVERDWRGLKSPPIQISTTSEERSVGVHTNRFCLRFDPGWSRFRRRHQRWSLSPPYLASAMLAAPAPPRIGRSPCSRPSPLEREMCLWAISKYFGDWVPTQMVLELNYAKLWMKCKSTQRNDSRLSTSVFMY